MNFLRPDTKGKNTIHRTTACIAVATLIAVCSGFARFAYVADALPNSTETPIKHVVVIFAENISFDHYYATYPQASNKPGELLQGSAIAAPQFHPLAGTPTPDNLLSAHLLDKNPNQVQPFRLTPAQAVTCDQDHTYRGEQEAFNNGEMNRFVETNLNEECTPHSGKHNAPGEVMGYYDGNTVTALWNLAQYFTLNDAHFGTVFGPSTPGALNLISGVSSGARTYDADQHQLITDPKHKATVSNRPDGTGTIIADPDPLYDDCSNKNGASHKPLVAVEGKNVGDLLNSQGVSWGWFQGGFRPTTPASDGRPAICGTRHANVAGDSSLDYSPHHQPFMYYKSTANQHHLPPTSLDAIGKTDQANHQYDLSDFFTALSSNNLPAVSFLKAAQYQDGHADYSDPLDEQHFLTKTLNLLQQSPEWSSTAVIYTYDDSDGWYDHVAPVIMNGSNDSTEDTSMCANAHKTHPALGGIHGRCGPGTRHPLLVISPYARKNAIDHTATEQTSILKFIEDNWRLGRISDISFDERAGRLDSMFDFSHPRKDKVWLNEITGAVTDMPSVSKLSDISQEAYAATNQSSQPPMHKGKIFLLLATISVAALISVFMARRRKQSK